jgi:hypothetical protein
MYIERKDGLTGPARIGRVAFSQTGRTLYYAGRSFRSLKGAGYKANYFDVESGEWYWICGPRKDGMDSLYPAKVVIDFDAREEYWTQVRGLPGCAQLAAFESPGKYTGRKPRPELAVHGSARNGGSRGGKRRAWERKTGQA